MGELIEAIRRERGSLWAASRDLPPAHRRRIASWAAYAGVLTLLFVQPLAGLLRLAAQTDLHSHAPLVPLIAAYLLYVQRRPGVPEYRSSLGGAVVLWILALAALGAAFAWRGTLSPTDHLALTTLAYISVVAAGGFLFLGAKWMAAAAFPMSFLMFMVPLPDALVQWLETGLVLGSAEVSAVLFNLAGTPHVRDGLIFELPTIVLLIADECSGIRSTWVLFITSLLASHLFLHSPWRRLVLVAFVIPLGIVRNGFRILTIGLLCVHIGPHMVDSFIHRRGGPIFFVLSLVPLFLFMMWLWRRERRTALPG